MNRQTRQTGPDRHARHAAPPAGRNPPADRTTDPPQHRRHTRRGPPVRPATPPPDPGQTRARPAKRRNETIGKRRKRPGTDTTPNRKTDTVSFRQQIRRATATRPFKTRKSRPANEPCRQHDPDARSDATCCRRLRARCASARCWHGSAGCAPQAIRPPPPCPTRYPGGELLVVATNTTGPGSALDYP